jgi:transposase
MTKHDIRKRALIQALFGKGYTVSAIADELGVSRPTVYLWSGREDIFQKEGAGRPSKLDKKTLASIERKLKKKGASQRKVAAQTGLSKSTVQAASKTLGLKPYHPQKRPFLTSEHKRKRVRFAKEYAEQDWGSVFFEDEKTFQVGSHPNRKNDVVYAYSLDEVPVIPTVKHPAKVHVAAAVSESGSSVLHMFEHNMDGAMFKKILKKTILPAATEIFGDSEWTLAMDNDPKHRSALVSDFLEEEDVQVIPKQDWPAPSPDLNPMENVWSMLLDRVNKKPPGTVAGLKKRLRTEWEYLPQSKIAAAVKSMPDRLKAVIIAKGAHTTY